MSVHGVLRLFACRPQADAVDVILRDVVAPGLLARDGLLDVFMARHGDEDDDARIVCTVWAADAAPTDAIEHDLLVTGGATLEGEAASRLDVLPVRIALRHDGRPEPAVLRVFRGTVREGAFDTYLESARSGALFDGATNAGAVALYLAAAEAPDFITVSAWVDWDSIAAATGGDIRRPFATRHQELLERLDAQHYEILPNVTRPANLVGAGRSG
ncbi:MAG TPA: hypothetical protein VFK54_00620 [Candidatus Limnocylindrales bacterium]|nr:hypothetical protein [Candidatus Limnocylindrales bacterium]